MKLFVKQKAYKEEGEFLVAINDELEQLAKPDLCNEAERLGISTTGTKKELRREILRKRVLQWREENYPNVSLREIDLDVLDEEEEEAEDKLEGDQIENGGENAQAEDDANQEGVDVEQNVDEYGREENAHLQHSFGGTPPHHSTPVGPAQAGIVDSSLLIRMMIEENRRRDEENRRREDRLMQELGRLHGELRSQTGSSSSVTTMQEFRRRSARCFRDIHPKLEELRNQIESDKFKEMRRLSDDVNQRVAKFDDFFENKIDLLDGDAEKDKLIKDWMSLRERALQEVYSAKAKLEEKKMIDSAGALPEKIKVPQFNGDLIKYPDWWEEYKAVVHENKKVSTFYKLTYLKSAMKGAATHVLDGISLKPENYEKALDLVQMRFGRKRVITRHLVRSLAKMEPVASGNPKAFLELADKLSARYTTLKTQVTDVDQLIIPLMEDKLPKEARQLWERKLGEVVDDDAFADAKMFFEFVQKEASAQTASSDDNPTKENSKKNDPKANKSDGKKSGDNPRFSAAALPSSVSSKTKKDYFYNLYLTNNVFPACALPKM